jgi:hypothetical protein
MSAHYSGAHGGATVVDLTALNNGGNGGEP